MKTQQTIVGHSYIKKYLLSLAVSDLMHHAYIFIGPHSLGKSKVAKLFIQTLLCHNKKNDIPCNRCISCTYFNQSIHPDFHTIKKDDTSDNTKKNISIGQIKELQEKLSTHSVLGDHKAVIIYDAQYLSDKAANALLKTLEEPTKNTVIILISSNAQKLLPTIKSRCQIIQFYQVNEDEIYDFLTNLNEDRANAKIISKIANGRPGLARVFFENPKLYENYKEKVSRCLHLIRQPIYEKIASSNSLFVHLKKSYTQSAEMVDDELNTWVAIMRDILLLKNSCTHLIQNFYLIDAMKNISNVISNNKIKEIILKIYYAKQLLSKNANPRAVYENFLINI